MAHQDLSSQMWEAYPCASLDKRLKPLGLTHLSPSVQVVHVTRDPGLQPTSRASREKRVFSYICMYIIYIFLFFFFNYIL
jgi:hypothetical protein